MYVVAIGKAALRHMTMFVKILQLVIHLPFMSIVLPANIIFTFEVLTPVVSFDFLDQFIEWRD